MRAASPQSEREHPLDALERAALGRSWAFERDNDDEMSACVDGQWTTYRVAVTWLDEIEAIHLSCGFELAVAERRRAEAAALAGLINGQLWLGHFDLWPEEKLVTFRHALTLAGGARAGAGQCEAMLAAAIDACERHYQAFHFVAWGGQTARQALDSAMLETVGRA